MTLRAVLKLFWVCGSGIFGLGRKFKIIDDDGSKSINMAEFLKAMRETEVNLDEATLRKLFTVRPSATANAPVILFSVVTTPVYMRVCIGVQYFDNDGSGTIDYDEFLVGVRGELNERRKALVQLVRIVLLSYRFAWC